MQQAEMISRTETLRRLNEKAAYFLALSNKKGDPQWSRKANAHAFAGVVSAIHIVQGMEP